MSEDELKRLRDIKNGFNDSIKFLKINKNKVLEPVFLINILEMIGNYAIDSRKRGIELLERVEDLETRLNSLDTNSGV